MIIQDEARFRHLAACIANAAAELQTAEVLIIKRIPATLGVMQGWLSEMGSLCGERAELAAYQGV